MQTLIQLFMIGIVGLFGAILFLLTIKDKYIILNVIFVGFALSTYEWVSGTTIALSLLGTQIGIADILCIYLLLCVVIYKRKMKMLRELCGICYIIILFFAIGGVIRGLTVNPFDKVFEDVRRYIWAFIVPAICIGLLPFSFDDKRTSMKIKKFTTFVIIYCFFCWFLDLVLGIHIMSPQSDAETTMRVLRPEQALVIAMLAVKSLYDDINSQDKKISKQTIVLIVTVILLQHRSAWMALAGGVGYLIVIAGIESGKAKKLLKSKKFVMQIALIGVVCIAGIFFMRNTPLFQQLLAGLEGLTGDQGTTLDYRHQLWTAHLATLNGIEWFVGKPFGSGYYISLSSYGREITPHSAYVQTIIRAGIVGISLVAIFILKVLVFSRKKHFGAGEAICVMFLVFFYPYSYNFFDSVILGLVISTACQRTIVREESYETI